MGQEEGSKVKLDEYGQLAIGYDLAKARAWVREHAQKNLPARYPWLQGVELTWEITSARFMEDQDAYEVIVSCYPEGAEVQAKGEWLYHVDVAGQLMPGTPILRTVGQWTLKGKGLRPTPGSESGSDTVVERQRFHLQWGAGRVDLERRLVVGDTVRGSVRVLPSSNWDNWSVVVLDPYGNQIFDRRGKSMRFDFEFAASVGGDYTLRIDNSHWRGKDVEIEVVPSGWVSVIETGRGKRVSR